MSKAIINEQSLTDIADAIRAKNGSADTYKPSEMATAITDLPTPQTVTKGLVFSDYDSDGYPHKAELVGFTAIPQYYLRHFGYTNQNSITSYAKKIEYIEIPSTITSFGGAMCYQCKVPIKWVSGYGLLAQEIFYSATFYTTDLVIPEGTTSPSGINAGSQFFGTNLTSVTIPTTINTIHYRMFGNCTKLKRVICNGNITQIGNNATNSDTAIELYDFSHNTEIPTLSNTDFGHANGCVIKIPLALSDTTLGTGNGWQSTTNWVSLTDVVWQEV